MTAHKSTHNNRWLLGFILALISLGASAFVGYASNDKELSNRITAVEVHVGDDRQTLAEIKAAIKDTNDKVTQILVIVGHPKH